MRNFGRLVRTMFSRQIFSAFVLGVFFLFGTLSVAEPTKKPAATDDQTGRMQLASGEWLESSSYGTINIIGGEKRRFIKVKFADDSASVSLRRKSIFELVTKELLPRAMKEGFKETTLQIQTNKKSFGILNIETTDDWTFRWVSGWKWEEISDHDVNWNYRYQPLPAIPGYQGELIAIGILDAQTNTNQSTRYLHFEAPDKVGLKGSFKEIIPLMRAYLNCDEQELAQPALQGISRLEFRVFPGRVQSRLDMMPNVRVSQNRKNGKFGCFTEKAIENSINNPNLPKSWEGWVPSYEMTFPKK